MKIPTKKQIEEAAHLELKKEAGSPFTAYIRGASYMEQQLEPIITKLGMENARLLTALTEIQKRYTDDPSTAYIFAICNQALNPNQ